MLERSGDIAAALRAARRALDLARSLHDTPGEAAARVAMADCRFRLGQYRAAEADARAALALAPADSPACVEALLRLASCVVQRGALAEAETTSRRAADIARAIGHQALLARALHSLAAGIYLTRGQFDLALAADQEAYRIVRDHDLASYLHYPLITLAWVCLLTGQVEAARGFIDELAPLAIQGSYIQGYHLCLSAHLALAEDDVAQALTYFDQALAVADASGDYWLVVVARLGISRCNRLMNRLPAARDWAGDAVALADHVSYPHMQGQALIERGRSAWLCGDPAGARADLETAIQMLAAIPAAFDLARGRLALSALLHGERHAEAQTAWAEAAQAILQGGYAALLEEERGLAFPLIAAYLDHPQLAQVSAALLKLLHDAPPPRLHVKLLGQLSVQQGSRAIETRALRQRRAGELLALLLLTPGRRLSCDQVAEALSPNKAPHEAQIVFHHATSSLRRALEPDLPEKFPSRYLTVEAGLATLHLPPGSVIDAWEFEERCRQGRWEDAIALYTGDLLPEYLYADWAMAQRQHLALRYQHALLAAAQTRLAAGRYAEALAACHHLLTLEPWQEEAVLIGMRACQALNDRAGALRLYRTLAQTLHNELGASPAPELQAFYRSLTRNSSPEA